MRFLRKNKGEPHKAYVCPMHQEVVAQKPGRCPKCHMALEKAAIPTVDADHDKHAEHNTNMFKQKFWVSLLLTIPTLLFSHTVQDWLGIELVFPGSEYIAALFGTSLFFYGGMVFIRSARGELAAKKPGMMTLISMAIMVAFSYSLAVTLRVVEGMDFWWELATLITIMLLGHWLEMASVSHAQNALNELAKLIPDEAELIDAKGSRLVAVNQLAVGDHIFLRPGAQIPIDGVVVKGRSEVDESMLTGESKTVTKSIGSEVVGGTVNSSGALTVEVTKTGDETALAGIMKLVEDAQASTSNAQALADKAAFYLTFIAIAAAAITWGSWWLLDASGGFILERVVTVLVIACPHALGLAIPLVTAISTTKAAQNGILIRRRTALEAARTIDVVLLDKTGTLTKGEQGVVSVVAVDDTKKLLSILTALERGSEHPIATAVMNYVKNKDILHLTARQFRAIPGQGVQAVVGKKNVYAGGANMLKEQHITVPIQFEKRVKKVLKAGTSVVYVAEEHTILGAVVLMDVIRETSKEAVERLQKMAKRVMIVTGDSKNVAEWVAKELGIEEYFAEVLPGDKTEVVKRLQRDGNKVAMVGDGINDAPSLVQADVGIAIGAGTDVAIESADIVLASSDPRGVAKIINLSEQTYRKMVQNLLWAVGYNAVAIPLAGGVASGVGFMLSPAVGAGVMSISTIIVALNAQLLRRAKLDD